MKKGKKKETKGKENKVCQQKLKKSKKIVRYSSESLNSNFEIKYDNEYIEETEENDLYSRKFLSVEKHKNEYVIISINGEYLPGKILKVNKNNAAITTMQKSKLLWKWPVTANVRDFKWENIVGKIEKPVKASKTRNFYTIPELNFKF